MLYETGAAFDQINHVLHFTLISCNIVMQSLTILSIEYEFGYRGSYVYHIRRFTFVLMDDMINRHT